MYCSKKCLIKFLPFLSNFYSWFLRLHRLDIRPFIEIQYPVPVGYRTVSGIRIDTRPKALKIYLHVLIDTVPTLLIVQSWSTVQFAVYLVCWIDAITW